VCSGSRTLNLLLLLFTKDALEPVQCVDSILSMVLEECGQLYILLNPDQTGESSDDIVVPGTPHDAARDAEEGCREYFVG